MTRTYLFSVLAMLVVLPAHAGAQLACGATVGKREKVTLTADVGPCDGDSGSTAAIVVDGGTLDLGGRTVTCADANLDGEVPQGVILFGKKSKVMNGSVVGCMNCVGLGGTVGCMNCVGLGGTGKHLVSGVTVQGCLDDGVDVTSDASKNKLVDVTATQNASDGVQVGSDKNKLTNVAARGNGQDGIDLESTADKNKLANVVAEGNADDGLEIGGDKNKVKTIAANGNGDTGIDFDGVKNKVSGGSAQSNLGVDVADCGGNKLAGVTFTTATSDCQ
jgi:hypothetical protein